MSRNYSLCKNSVKPWKMAVETIMFYASYFGVVGVNFVFLFAIEC